MGRTRTACNDNSGKPRYRTTNRHIAQTSGLLRLQERDATPTTNRLSKTQVPPSMGCATPNLLNLDRHSRQSLTSLRWLIGSDGLGTRVLAGKPAMAAPLLGSLHLDGSDLRFLGQGARQLGSLYYSSMGAMHIVAAGTEQP